MIWVGGAIVPDEALRISVLDRTFEHGLGLFETFRTWDGHATLLNRHLARMSRSAAELCLPLDPAALPDAGAVSALLRADGRDGDAVLRITLSGGTAAAGSSIVWMRSAPIPAPMEKDGGATIHAGRFRIAPGDPLARHKSLNYWTRRMAFEEARAAGADEAMLLGIEPGRESLLEGSRTNVFAVFGDTLHTPGADAPILPGIMRAVVLERAPGLGMKVEQGHWNPFGARGRPSEGPRLGLVDEVFLTNSARGIIPVRRVMEYAYRSPGVWTTRLREAIHQALGKGEA